MNTKILLDALCAHYRKPGEDQDGEILLTEVTAPRSNRSCDLLRVGMWASRGLGIDVHELKTSRSDWLRELDQPAKADAWWPYCNRFWVVAPAGVVQAAELPEGWGLLNPPANSRHRRFKTIVKAATKQPNLTVGLLAAIVKRTDNTRVREIERLRTDHRNEVFRAVQAERVRREERSLPEVMRQQLKAAQQIEAIIGAKLADYGWGDDLPLDRITAPDVVTALREYTQNHVALQRRQAQLDDDRRRLAESAAALLTRLTPTH